MLERDEIVHNLNNRHNPRLQHSLPKCVEIRRQSGPGGILRLMRLTDGLRLNARTRTADRPATELAASRS